MQNTHMTDYWSSKECSRKNASKNSIMSSRPICKIALKRKVGYEVDNEEAMMRKKMLLD